MKLKQLWSPPKDLGEHGIQLFRRVGKLLIKSESLTKFDRETFETLCRDYELMRSAGKELETDGVTIKGERNVKKKHPAFPVWKVAHDNYVTLLKHFGLSPLSRGLKVEAKETEKKNGKEKFFN